MNSRWSGPRAALLPGLFALVLWPVGSLWGQAATGAGGTVLGRVLDAETGAPQVGAFVALLDASEHRSAGALSDETGRFVLRVPEPGRYRLRVEGMGLESLRSPAFEVEAGGVQVMDLRTEAAAVRLTGLEVTGTARCSLDESDGSATVRLWDEARKSLEVAEWVDDVGYVYQVTRTRRILGPDAERVYEEESSRVTLTGRAAFRSIDAESLVRDGFVQTDSAGTSYYGPDASVLLSDLFLSAHCFQAVREDGRLGLAFEPGPDRDVPDIRGTLWIREEGGLDRLEYRYTGLPGDMDSQHLGGDVYFERLPQGEWIVRRWRIRMPWEVEAGPGVSGRLSRMVEVGGLIREARSVARIAPLFRERRGALMGRVRVQGGGEGPESGRVFLSGTGHAATPGLDGGFLLEDVEPGIYDLVVQHPGLTALGEGSRTLEVRVLADSLAAAEVEIPSREAVLTQRCSGEPLLELQPPDTRSGAPRLLGGVVLDAQGDPVSNWPVRVLWRGYRLVDRGGRPSGVRVQGGGSLTGAAEEWRGQVVFSGPFGGWAVCGLPDDESVSVEVADRRLSPAEVEAGQGDWRSGEQVAAFPAGASRWVSLQVDRASRP